MQTAVSIEHRKRMLRHLKRQEHAAMGLKYTVETVGELRKVLANIHDDAPFEIICDDVQVQSFSDRSGWFVKFTPSDLK